VSLFGAHAEVDVIRRALSSQGRGERGEADGHVRCELQQEIGDSMSGHEW
jgi:hypothetical protein